MTDAENAKPNALGLVLEHLKIHYSTPLHNMSIRRIYGKSNVLSSSSWQPIICDYSILPFHTQSGNKNAADIDLIVDAMDILHTQKHIDAVIILTSDKDFTRLVQRLREANLTVIGVGERNTQMGDSRIANVCHHYIYTEDVVREEAKRLELRRLEAKRLELHGLQVEEQRKQHRQQIEDLMEQEQQREKTENINRAANTEGILQRWQKLLSTFMFGMTMPLSKEDLTVLIGAIKEHSNTKGWSNISNISGYVEHQKYGYKKLSEMLRDLPGDEFEMKREPNGILTKHNLK